MRCLMRHINSPSMTDNCKNNLLEIMYFVSRNWQLDPQLYAACKEDSVNFCHAEPGWLEGANAGAEGDILVLPCLFRYTYQPKRDEVSR